LSLATVGLCTAESDDEMVCESVFYTLNVPLSEVYEKGQFICVRESWTESGVNHTKTTCYPKLQALSTLLWSESCTSVSCIILSGPVLIADAVDTLWNMFWGKLVEAFGFGAHSFVVPSTKNPITICEEGGDVGSHKQSASM